MVSEQSTPQVRTRMSGQERREQLIEIGRALIAERGFDATTVEEIAASAGVTKPVVYEHFGGKEGLYAVVVDREVTKLLDSIKGALVAGHPRQVLGTQFRWFSDSGARRPRSDDYGHLRQFDQRCGLASRRPAA